VPFEFNGRREILVAGGDCISGHDPATGKELWRWGTWNPTRITHWRLVPSPLGAGAIVLACAPKGSPVYAVKAGLSGNLGDADLAWVSTTREVSSDVSTPLHYQGSIYLLNSDRKLLSRLEPATGRVIWQGELAARSKFEASPLGADGRIYLINHDGQVFVVRAGGDEFALLHQTDMGDDNDRELRSSVIAARGQLFVRTGRKLYCLQK
jgi:outer membrane protein assembly factor BamB